MQIIRILLCFFLSISCIYAQDIETLINSDFAIRDFTIDNDSIIYIKKRNVFLKDLNSNSTSNYFIGGYGLKLEKLNADEIITVSNELVRNVSSIRYLNKSSKTITDVYYYKEGKILDYLKIPGIDVFVLSTTNKKILFIDFSERPRFLKTVEIKINSLSRRLSYRENKLYYATDDGEIYEYNIKDNNKVMIYKTNYPITDYVLNKNYIILSTIKGEIIKYNVDNKKLKKIRLNNNFVLNSIIKEKNLICGSWNGIIYNIDMEDFSIKNELKIHKRSILKIFSGLNNKFYSSGLDKTLKMWKLN